MRVREKNPLLKKLIKDLYVRGKQGKPILSAVAELLNRPRRRCHKVNLYHIEKHAKKGSNVIVPGIVLGTGSISKSVNVYALKFSKSAKDKIEKAGGKCLCLEELLKKVPKNPLLLG